MRSNRCWPPTVPLVLFVAIAAALAPLAVAADDDSRASSASLEGHWNGTIDVPGQQLGIEIELTRAEDGALSGRISIPAQNLRRIELTGFEREGRQIRFAIAPTPGIPGNPKFDGEVTPDGEQIQGTFEQSAMQFPFTLERGPDAVERAQNALQGFGRVARKAREAFNVPGLAISVVVGGKVVFSEGYGYRDLEDQLPMTPDTLFAVGSTTKAMTATLLGTLVDEGKLDWDAPVREYLPRFSLADPMISPRVTVRDLLTHRTGLPRHDAVWYNDNEITREEMVAALEHLPMAADLREKFIYNNLMFVTAGHVAEQITGESWEELLRERLFEPIGMERSNFSVETSKQDPDHALPYRENDEGELERIPFRPLDKVGPAGSVNSSVDEMSRWVAFNLLRGKAGGQTLIEGATLQEIHSPQMALQAAPERKDISSPSYGMGWFVRTYRGHRQIYHGGGIDGFVTSVTMFPDEELGIVAFDNRGSGLAELLSRHAADRVLGLDRIDWIGDAVKQRQKAEQAQEDAKARQRDERVEGTKPSRPVEAFAGVYEHPGYGQLEIDHRDGGLVLRFNGIETPLEHWHYDVWSGAETDGDATFEGQKLIFRSNLDGAVAAVESRMEPMVDPITFERIPDPKLSDPEFLERLTGTYTMAVGTPVEVGLSAEGLTLTVPGQPTYTLVPDLGGRFTLKDYPAIQVSFELGEEGRATTVRLHQPQGTFEATR